MRYEKIYEWLQTYLHTEELTEHDVHTVALWHASGTHEAYPHWVMAQLRLDPDEKEVA